MAGDKKEHCEHLPSSFGMKPGAEKFPLMVLAQVSNVCNSQCVHCWFNAKKRLRLRDGQSYMAAKILQKIIDEMAEEKEERPLLRITGTGEPFLMPRLKDILLEACQKKVRVGIITNGSLLTPDLADPLLEAGLETLELSVDAADKESYERIRKGLRFEVIMRNIEHLISYRNRIGSPTKILVSFVENPKEIQPDVVESFWRERVDNVIRRKYLTYGQLSEEGYSKETYLPTDQRVPCPYPFERMAILASGNVTFCNFDVEDGYFMGKVSEQSVREVWQGAKFKGWRELVLARRFEEIPLCAKCQDWKYKSWSHNFFKVLLETEARKKDYPPQ